MKRGTHSKNKNHSSAEQKIEELDIDEISLFKTLIDYSHEYVNIADPKTGKLLYANQGLCEQTGYHKDEIKGITVFDLDPSLDDAYITEHLIALRKNKYAQIDTNWKRKNGEIFPVQVNVSLINIEGKEFFIAFTHEITERQEIRKKLEESNEKFKKIIETSSDWLWELDLTGTFKELSPQVLSILGYTQNELVGKKTYNFRTKTEGKRVQDFYADTINKQISFTGFVNEYLNKDGRKVIIESSGVPIFDEYHELTGYRGISRDITEQKQINDFLVFLAERRIEQDSADFFKDVVNYLGKSLDVAYVFIDKLKDLKTAQTIALYSHGKVEPNIEYELKYTPCENVIGKNLCVYSDGIQKLFPKDELLVAMNAESYVGIPLWDSKREAIGLIAIIDEQPLFKIETIEALLQIAAVRTASEMERRENVETLNKAHDTLVTVLDSLDAQVYVIDMETYEVLFANESLRKKNPEIIGKVCWKVLREDQNEPCDDCNNSALLKLAGTGEVITSENYNLDIEKWLQTRSQAIRWIDGRIVRLEVATDITKLKHAEKEFKTLSYTDYLTGIGNRRSFEKNYSQEWQRARRSSLPLSVIMLDVDYFKQYNDEYGHPEGDICLRRVARIVNNSLHRAGDFVYRYGGEEFIISMYDTDEEGARMIAEKMRLMVEREMIKHANSDISLFVTISLGVSTQIPDKDSESEDLVAKADIALYKAKQAGRNRVEKS